jgi:hypothetical protein
MTSLAGADTGYQGFEQGPIRPPSEAGSLLIRVTRNCPWNRCTFCPVYKHTTFSVRPVAHVNRDLDAVSAALQELNRGERADISRAPDRLAWQAARNWLRHGARHVFLQDANSLIIPPQDLLAIVHRIKQLFPGVSRITSYARSGSIARLGDEDLAALRQAGLNRIHIGLESGADVVLRLVRKGTTRRQQISAGLKVKKAGLELSEYYMPGLGGQRYLESNALETAAALNQINPDFIRLRTLALPEAAPLTAECRAGRFDPSTDLMIVQELLLFLEALSGIDSTIKSDHILNLLPEIDGRLPQDRERLLDVGRTFLALDPELQFRYRVGRRAGILSGLTDLKDPGLLFRVEALCRARGITPENVESVTAAWMRRFI